MDNYNVRVFAMQQAVALHAPHFKANDHGNAALRATADVIYGWVLGPVALVITLGPPVDQATGQPTGTPQGGPMKDSEKCPLIVQATDAKGQVTTVGADVTFTVADSTVATISDPDADGIRWVVAGLPGSTVVTGDWPDSPSGDLPGTVAVDVTAGDATSLQISLGTPVAQ